MSENFALEKFKRVRSESKIKFLGEKEAKRKREELEEQLLKDPTKKDYEFSSKKINWIDEVGG